MAQMANIKEIAAWLEKTARVEFDELHFDCRVLDAKLSYGKVRLRVQPVSGTGEVWVDASRATVLEAQ